MNCAGLQILKVMVSGNMPELLFRRFDVRWSDHFDLNSVIGVPQCVAIVRDMGVIKLYN
jgi:hypothetical protein